MGKYTKWLFAINEIEGLKKCKNKTVFMSKLKEQTPHSNRINSYSKQEILNKQ